MKNCFNNYKWLYTSLYACDFIFLQKVSLGSNGINFAQMLQEIAQEANFVTTYVEIEEKSVTGGYANVR